LNISFIFILTSLGTSRLFFFLIAPIDLFSVWQQAHLLESKTMPHALRVNFEN